jgi:hypothetical protein
MSSQVWQAFSLLYRYPAFGRLWVGRLVSLFGDAIALIALPWFVLQVTGSGTATAGILLTLHLPAILTSLVIGSLIDRFQPRVIISIDNGLRTLIIGLIPILYWFGLLELWMLFLLTFLAGMLVPATEVGARSILPDLVEDKDLDAANMLWSALALGALIGTLSSTTQRPQGTVGQSIWSPFHIAHRRIAAGFGYRRHTAGLRAIDHRDCAFGFRLYSGRFCWAYIVNLARFGASDCRLRCLGERSDGSSMFL